EAGRPRGDGRLAIEWPTAVVVLGRDQPRDTSVGGGAIGGLQARQRQCCERGRLRVAGSTPVCRPTPVTILRGMQRGHGLGNHHGLPTRSDQLMPSGKRNFVTVLPLALRPVNQSSCSHNTPCASSTRATNPR